MNKSVAFGCLDGQYTPNSNGNTQRGSKMRNIINNQAETFIHLTLEADAAYQYSVDNNDPINMQMVLRAYGEGHSYDQAEKQIEVARNFS